MHHRYHYFLSSMSEHMREILNFVCSRKYLWSCTLRRVVQCPVVGIAISIPRGGLTMIGWEGTQGDLVISRHLVTWGRAPPWFMYGWWKLSQCIKFINQWLLNTFPMQAAFCVATNLEKPISEVFNRNLERSSRMVWFRWKGIRCWDNRGINHLFIQQRSHNPPMQCICRCLDRRNNFLLIPQ